MIAHISIPGLVHPHSLAWHNGVLASKLSSLRMPSRQYGPTDCQVRELEFTPPHYYISDSLRILTAELFTSPTAKLSPIAPGNARECCSVLRRYLSSPSCTQHQIHAPYSVSSQHLLSLSHSDRCSIGWRYPPVTSDFTSTAFVVCVMPPFPLVAQGVGA